MSPELHGYFSLAAEWLSAVGTVGAVIVALWLARRDSRVSLQVRAGIRTIATSLPGDEPVEGITVAVTNVGRRATRVTALFWRAGIVRRRLFFQVLSSSPHSSPIPIRLADGDEATFFFPTKTFGESNGKFIQEVLGAFPSLNAFFIEALVRTSSGAEFRVRVEPSMRTWLIEQASRS